MDNVIQRKKAEVKKLSAEVEYEILLQLLTLSGARSPAIIFKTVDFPVPEGPIIPTASPCLICPMGKDKIELIYLDGVELIAERNN